MLPDEVRKAVERLREIAHRDEAKGVTVRADDLRAALAHLLAREAEVEQLNAACRQHLTRALENGQEARIQQDRCERADALLRECREVFEPEPYKGSYQAVALIARITAHLSENSRG